MYLISDHVQLLTQVQRRRKQISTALIMEDDSDWDMNLKAQMIEFARGTRSQQEPPN